jgi:hypothetical protein
MEQETDHNILIRIDERVGDIKEDVGELKETVQTTARSPSLRPQTASRSSGRLALWFSSLACFSGYRRLSVTPPLQVGGPTSGEPISGLWRIRFVSPTAPTQRGLPTSG